MLVAVIDTEIDANHKDLSENLWSGPKDGIRQIAKARTYGWDFVKNSPNPGDDHGHGTHVAGIIGAMNDPKTGISGVSLIVSIMPVKYYSETNPGSVNLANTIKALSLCCRKRR